MPPVSLEMEAPPPPPPPAEEAGGGGGNDELPMLWCPAQDAVDGMAYGSESRPGAQRRRRGGGGSAVGVAARAKTLRSFFGLVQRSMGSGPPQRGAPESFDAAAEKETHVGEGLGDVSATGKGQQADGAPRGPLAARAAHRVLDPRGRRVLLWDRVFVVVNVLAGLTLTAVRVGDASTAAAALASVFVDPLFFYAPVVSGSLCIYVPAALRPPLTALRSVLDAFWLVHIALQFWLPVEVTLPAQFGRPYDQRVLVSNFRVVVQHYLCGPFWLDVLAALPLPQVYMNAVIPQLGSASEGVRVAVRLSSLLQLGPRVARLLPSLAKMRDLLGVIVKNSWAGAAYNLVFYILASHVIGAIWYAFSVQRIDYCWRRYCHRQQGSPAGSCRSAFFDCGEAGSPARSRWLGSDSWAAIAASCRDGPDLFDYGIYTPAVASHIVQDATFCNRLFYSLRWGLVNLSTLGQGLFPTPSVAQGLACIGLVILGLLLFSHLIGGMQTYLASTTLRLEEARVKRRDVKSWMQHRQLPRMFRERINRFEEYKFMATRGADEEQLVMNLSPDIRRDVKRHLALDLVLKVPLFSEMEDSVLDAICERLKAAIFVEGTTLLREGDPLPCMFFFVSGKVESVTTNGGRSGFHTQGLLGPGDFCGEELLTWALDPNQSTQLPSSTRTIIVLKECEAFSLGVDDLLYVTDHMGRIHTRRLRHMYRYYSHLWRHWAAGVIQTRWHRYKQRQVDTIRREEEQAALQAAVLEAAASAAAGERLTNEPGVAAAAHIAMFAKSTMRTWRKKRVVDALRDDVDAAQRRPSEPAFLYNSSSESDGDDSDNNSHNNMAVETPVAMFYSSRLPQVRRVPTTGPLNYIPPRSGFLGVPRTNAAVPGRLGHEMGRRSHVSNVPKSGLL
eukprot:SM000255S08778  [mRNA]  locus=s255:112425:117282:- [translate_table: standard]